MHDNCLSSLLIHTTLDDEALLHSDVLPQQGEICVQITQGKVYQYDEPNPAKDLEWATIPQTEICHERMKRRLIIEWGMPSAS